MKTPFRSIEEATEAANAWRDGHAEAAACNTVLREQVKRLAWLCGELHAGNQFSADDYWRWARAAENAVARTGGN